MTLTDADIKELFGIIQYSTRKNIQYGDYLYDTIIEDSKIVKGIERLLDEQTNATTMEDGYYFILKIVQILKTARNIPLTTNDTITERSSEDKQ